MATATVIEENPLNWYSSSKDESLHDRLDKRIEQVEALSQIMVSAEFHEFNDVIKHRVNWLMSDLLRDIREDWQELGEARAKIRKVAGVDEDGAVQVA